MGALALERPWLPRMRMSLVDSNGSAEGGDGCCGGAGADDERQRWRLESDIALPRKVAPISGNCVDLQVSQNGEYVGDRDADGAAAAVRSCGPPATDKLL